MPAWDTLPTHALSAGEAISAADSKGANGNAPRATEQYRRKIVDFIKVLLERRVENSQSKNA
jgi:hypothetical protein